MVDAQEEAKAAMETEAEVLKTATKVAEVAVLQADICTDTAIRLLIVLLSTHVGGNGAYDSGET